MLKHLFVGKSNPCSRLVYTHLAKTGGNSITGFLNQIADEYGLNSLGISGSSSANASREHIENLLSRHGIRDKDLHIILGHIPFSVSRELFPGSLFTTALRVPEEQFISSYCSQPSNKEREDFGMSDFIAMVEENPYAEWAMDNHQTRMLCDEPDFGKPSNEAMLRSAKQNVKKHYALVGFKEHMEDYLRSLAALYGFPTTAIAFSRLNETGKYKPFIQSHHLEYARQRNALDMLLYEWARRQNFPRTSHLTMPAPVARSARTNIWI